MLFPLDTEDSGQVLLKNPDIFFSHCPFICAMMDCAGAPNFPNGTH